MTCRFLRLLAALAWLCLGAGVPSAEAQWYKTYEAGVKAVKDQNWAEAEKKLAQSVEEARKDGRSPGASVLWYSQIRKPFVPDLYLAIVYAHTNKPAEANAALERAARLLKANDPEFVSARSRVDAALSSAAANAANTGAPPAIDPPKSNPSTTGTGPPGRGDESAARRTQFDQDMQQAREELAAKRFDTAASAAARARSLNVNAAPVDDLVKRIEFERLFTSAETALQARQFDAAILSAGKARTAGLEPARADALMRRIERDRALAQAQTELDSRRFAAARTAAGEASRLGADAGAVRNLQSQIDRGQAEDAVRQSLSAGDAKTAAGAIAALRTLDPRNAQLAAFDLSLVALTTGDAQRLALLAFYQGNYKETIRLLTPLDAGARAPARVHFYLACSEAALALLGPPAEASARIRAARLRYQRTAGHNELTQDRRFIAPKILRALETGG
ncbi:MAG TPA: hypothetical protein VGI12_14690 [Vicinamibacterales bacterium]|jgi:hypothetical protein